MELVLETMLLVPFAVVYLVWLSVQHAAAIGSVDTKTTLTLVSMGVVTAVPLLLFAKGVRGIRMITFGLTQQMAQPQALTQHIATSGKC